MTYTKQKLASGRGGASAFTRSPQEALRSLGSLKHLIWLLNQHSSVHFAVIALISGRATPRDWRRALDQLQKRHPILSVCIAETGYTRLSKNAAFAARLDELKASAAEGAVATKREVLEELTKIGFANMADYVGRDDITLPVPKLTGDQAAAIREYTVEDYVEGHGDDAKTVKKIKIKLADKRGALVDLGRHHKAVHRQGWRQGWRPDRGENHDRVCAPAEANG
jgi:hypothetical protein